MKSDKKSTYQELEKQITELKKHQENTAIQNDHSYHNLYNSMAQNFMLVELIYNENGKVIDFCYLEVNPAFEKLVAKPKEELINKRAKEVFGKIDEYWLDIYEKVDKIGEPISDSNHSGEMNRYYSTQAWQVKKGIIASTFIDITEQKLAANQLKQAKEKNYKMLFDSTTDMFEIFELVYDKYGKPIDCYFREVNPALEKMLGKSRAQLINKRVRSLFDFEDHWLEICHKAITTGESVKFEDFVAEFDQYFLGICWKVDDNKVAIIITDVSEKTRKEIELKQVKEKEYKMLFDSMTEMVGIIELIYDKQGQPIDFYYRDVNQSFANLHGKPKDQLINKKASSVVGTIEAYWLTSFAGVDKTGTATNFENYGVEFDKYYSVSAWKISKNRVGVAFTDITEKRRIEEHKAEIKLQLEKIRKESNETEKLANIGSWIFNVTTQKVEWSDEMFNIWGFDQKKGTPDYDALLKRIHIDDFELYDSSINKAIALGTPFNMEFRIYIPNKEPKMIKAICHKAILGPNHRIIKLQGINQDITKQKLLEKELVEHERLKALGEMSASIAHDFNNSLQEMTGNLDILKLQHNLSDSALERITSTRSIITGVASRVSALQHFGDTEHYSKKAELINFNTVIEESLKESRPLWKDNMEKEGLTVNITTRFEDIPNVNCDLGEIKSVIYNLIKNSIEAMPKGGDIIIKTGTKVEGVFVTFTDTGKGMDEETKLKIFQPFYSTKGFTIGRGLGMSGVYSIVKKHKGDIAVKFSELSKGTIVEIVFPIGQRDEIKDISKNEPEPKDKLALRVLWVDDDTTIRENASELLELIGHNCDNVNSGKSALDYLNKNTYDIVFTDIGMPEMNGWELAESVRAKFGGKIKIVVVTGWDIDEKTKNEHNIDFVLQKPFTMEALEKIFTVI